MLGGDITKCEGLANMMMVVTGAHLKPLRLNYGFGKFPHSSAEVMNIIAQLWHHLHSFNKADICWGELDFVLKAPAVVHIVLTNKRFIRCEIVSRG